MIQRATVMVARRMPAVPGTKVAIGKLSKSPNLKGVSKISKAQPMKGLRLKESIAQVLRRIKRENQRSKSYYAALQYNGPANAFVAAHFDFGQQPDLDPLTARPSLRVRQNGKRREMDVSEQSAVPSRLFTRHTKLSYE